MSLLVAPILDGLESHALRLGRFERVNSHEPKNAPGHGLTCAIWVQSIGPQPGGSGLSSTTGRLVFNVRIYQNMLSQPVDAIDPLVLEAVAGLMGAYSGDFDLDVAQVRAIDLLGIAGIALSAVAGYVEIDHKHYRVMTITVPVIVNDVWTQAA